MAIAKEINPADIQPDITNDLIKGIVSRLYAVFGNSYTFYAEDVPQGFQTPCFAVISMNTIMQSGLKDRKYWQFPFDVHYFCDSNKPRQEWNTIQQKLALELQRIDACNTSLKGEIQPPNYDSEQQVGHVYVMYGIHLADVWEEPDKMESIELTELPEENGDIHVGGECDNESCPIDWR